VLHYKFFYSVRVIQIFALLLLSSATLAQPSARMGISPNRYQISFDERGTQTQSLMVQNLTNEPMTVRLSVGTWELDENNRLLEIPPSENSLDRSIVVNPLQITVPPGSPQTFRWTIIPRLKPVDGEHRAIIYIEELLPEVNESNEGARVRMKMRYGLPIYAHVGERVLSAELNAVNVDRDNNRVFLDITNTGNTHGRMGGSYGVWPVAQFPGTEEALRQIRRAVNRDTQPENFLLGSMPGTVILPENRRSLPLDIVVGQPGDYVVQLDAEFAGLEITDHIEITEPDS